jgi:PAP2 superfamily
MSENHETGEGLYPCERWDEPFREMPDRKPQRALLDFDDFKDPSKWGLSSPAAKVAIECPVLIKYQKNDRPSQESDIVRDAIEERRAIQRVLDEFGLNYDLDPQALQLVALINDNASYPIYQFKKTYARARPWQMCSQKLEPSFPPGHFLHPGHGAYPSGHATFVHLWVELIGALQKDPAKTANALVAANAVAKRREIAGLHYPSDSEAGQKLGINIAQRIIEAGRLTPFEKMALLQQ